MPTVLIVPGILGTNLVVRRPGRAGAYTLWLSYAELLQKGLARLRLEEDGTTEYVETYRGQVVAGGPLEHYYGLLKASLLERSWTVVDWGFDWRHSISDNGASLATYIAGPLSSKPVYLIGHSLGGLVCRWAYSVLANAGHADYIARIVTLGTPHYGSYGMVQAFAGIGDLFRQIVTAVYAARVLSPTILLLDAQVAAPLSSWPSSYQLFPDPLGPSAPDDPKRPDMYLPATWAERSPIPFTSRLEGIPAWWNSMRGKLPPAQMMVTVIGKGADTPVRTVAGDPFHTGDYVYVDGDNTIPVIDASVPQYPVCSVRGAHESLPRHPKVIELLTTLLLDGLAQAADYPGKFIE